MTTETYIPDPQRFTNNDNQVIALESIIIVFLCVYVFWLQKMFSLERKEINKSLSEVSAAVNMLVGASNVKK